MVEFYYNNVNFCEGYYSPKLLATSPSNLQIMSVLFLYKLIRFLSGCLFVYTFSQFLQVESYLRTKTFTNTRQRASFREHRHDQAEEILLAR